MTTRCLCSLARGPSPAVSFDARRRVVVQGRWEAKASERVEAAWTNLLAAEARWADASTNAEVTRAWSRHPLVSVLCGAKRELAPADSAAAETRRALVLTQQVHSKLKSEELSASTSALEGGRIEEPERCVVAEQRRTGSAVLDALGLSVSVGVERGRWALRRPRSLAISPRCRARGAGLQGSWVTS